MKLEILSSASALLAMSNVASASPIDPAGATSSTIVPQPIITPTTGHVNLGEQVPPEISREEQADQYLFNMTLESFITLRDERYPSYFWWESDGCSQSSDRPFGFEFLPACYRHDFGYDQYKHQNRFTPETKDKLDRNFRADMYHICSAPDLKNEICEACAEDPHRGDFDCKHRADMCKFPQQDVCKCLGDMYYTAVKKFGRKQKSRPRGLFNFHVPSIDLVQLAMCINRNLHSADGKPVD